MPVATTKKHREARWATWKSGIIIRTAAGGKPRSMKIGVKRFQGRAAVRANPTIYRPRADDAARNPKSGGTHDRSLRDYNVQQCRGESGWNPNLSFFLTLYVIQGTIEAYGKCRMGLPKATRAFSVADLPRGSAKKCKRKREEGKDERDS